jgi:hypothetical protein
MLEINSLGIPLAPPELDFLEGVADASLMGIMRLFAKNPFDAPSVWRMVSWSPCT